MAGIVTYGAYVPIYRLGQHVLGAVWGTSSGRGEKAVANYDEDAITMAVEAVTDCLKGIDRKSIDALYFASTSPPYREKQCASIVAAAADLRRDIITFDFANSLRSGTNALRAAIDSVKAGSCSRVVVVASDCRLPAPNSASESLLGDGAAALLIDNSELSATIEYQYTISSEFLDTWRTEQDKYPRMWEDRFVYSEYVTQIKETVSALTQKARLSADDFNKAVIYAPDSRRHQDIAKALRLDYKNKVQDPLFDQLGNTGAAFSMMMLVSALEEANSGDKILFVSYGDGCDSIILQTTKQICRIKDRRGMKYHLSSKMDLPSYGKYLRFRNLLEWEAELRPPDRTSLTLVNRQRRSIYALIGQKCKCCGGIQYPPLKICSWCQEKGQFEEFSLQDKKGNLFTYSMDERAMEVDLPNILCTVDFEGGGRFYSQVTDRDPEKLEIGMAMEPTFRKIHDGSGVHNYFWKVRPVRVDMQGK
ncbi:MAG: 3-oxoacyl-[acyl-carrier-protein] synthase III C-terminal domain-containing protein [Chloroflexota bacterium]|nr:3-oxoacyl-[acyl-carrier-protein] synthase III C-terminal domain-containing protein [Chloroflexota bacterium]